MEHQKGGTYVFTVNFWNHKKEMFRKQFPFLTENDLHYEPGNLNELMNRLCIKLDKTDHQLRELIITL